MFDTSPNTAALRRHLANTEPGPAGLFDLVVRHYRDSAAAEVLCKHAEGSFPLLVVMLVGVDGLSSWVDGQPVIGLDPLQPGDRFRFTLLHELRHLTMHRTKSDATEDEANHLAGAVLIPESDFDVAIQGSPTISDFVEMKKQWGISVAVLVYRGRELGYVGDRRYRSLQIQMSKWRRNEPAMFDAAHGKPLSKFGRVERRRRERCPRDGNQSRTHQRANFMVRPAAGPLASRRMQRNDLRRYACGVDRNAPSHQIERPTK